MSRVKRRPGESLDWRVFGYAFGTALVTGLVVGIVPALRGSGRGVIEAIRNGGRTMTGSRSHLRMVLVAAAALDQR